MKGAIRRPSIAATLLAMAGLSSAPIRAESVATNLQRLELPKPIDAGRSRGRGGKYSSRPRRRRRSGLHAGHPRRRRYIRYQRSGGVR